MSKNNGIEFNCIAPRLIPLNLQLFADGGSGEKTEEATPRKKKKAREEGQVAKSLEITTAAILVGMFTLLKFFGPFMIRELIDIMKVAFRSILMEDVSVQTMSQVYFFYAGKAAIIILPILGTSFLIGLISNLAQVGWHITTKPLIPKFNKLNPVSGFKRILSMRSLVELVKSILKLSIISIIVYLTLRDYEKLMLRLYETDVYETYAYIGNIVIDLGIRVGLYFIIVAATDFAYQKYKHKKDLKMTKQEIKEEHKMSEGNPEIKSKIRQKMREAAMRRMMQELPSADVIITNPTHFAVAIRYEEATTTAPVVIAKGADLLAGRIKEKAKQYDIHIMENKKLARTLYYTVEIGEEIPPELYQAVAEVLAFVYSLKNPT